MREGEGTRKKQWRITEERGSPWGRASSLEFLFGSLDLGGNSVHVTSAVLMQYKKETNEKGPTYERSDRSGRVVSSS